VEKSSNSLPAGRRGIKSWPETERPRERLLQSGVSSLTDAELLAVLLRSGTRGKDAIELARELLRGFGWFRRPLTVIETVPLRTTPNFFNFL
jgi:DNA repair protein RadC